MFERFLSRFEATPSALGGAWEDPRLLAASGYAELAHKHAGRSFENGLYRLHDSSTGPQALGWVRDAFPEFEGRACPFGYDWLGRQFAVDSGRIVGGQPLVLLLEPGSGEALEIPLSLSAFHEEELVDYADAALAQGFFEEWAGGHPGDLPLEQDQCVGYRVPLFLGGRDAVDNLEVTDLDVYWTICGQLRQGTVSLPPGTSISEVAGRAD